MAKKARRKPAARSRAARPAAGTPRDSIVDALMALLATRRLGQIGLAEVAEEAGVSLGTLRENYDGKLAILADFRRRIDRVVLDEGPAEGETIRDRLFEVLMRRFDALAPYKDAIRNVARSARCDPCLGRVLHRGGQRSMKWMLVAAGGAPNGIVGLIAVEGLLLVETEALRVWLDDDDPGLAKTMAALDRGLDRGERTMRLINRVCNRFGPVRDRRREGEASAAA